MQWRLLLWPFTWLLIRVFVISLSFVLGGLRLEWTYAQDKVQNLAHPDRIAAGAAIFAKTCALSACHGDAGKGGGAPVLRGRPWRPYRLWKIVHDASGVGLMPPFGNKLTDDEIWAVIAYVMSLSSNPSMPSASPARPGSENTSP